MKWKRRTNIMKAFKTGEHMKLLQTITLIGLSTTLLLAGQVSKEDKRMAQTLKTGQKGSQKLIKTLGSKLKKKIVDGGEMKALSFCADEAYNITQEVNRQLPVGVRVKRISQKQRSPANSPLADEIAVLESFDALNKANVVLPKELVQKVDSNTYKYYKPLLINTAMCLRCHGETSKDIEFKRALAERYPLDNAMNYKKGDFRGAVVVTIIYK